jgi:hypothetical protein
MEPRGCMQSCGIAGTGTAGNGSIGFGASSGLVVDPSAVTGLRRLIAPMRNRSLLTGLPSGLKPAGAIHIGSEDAGPRVAAIISVVETCWRLKIPVRDYLGSVLPGLGAFPITRIAQLTPAAWATRN